MQPEPVSWHQHSPIPGNRKFPKCREKILRAPPEVRLREIFVDVELSVERLTYVYQYMTAAQTLVFRYDNTGHHRQLNLPTYPDHKHEGSEANVIASPAPDLTAVLHEIETYVNLTP